MMKVCLRKSFLIENLVDETRALLPAGVVTPDAVKSVESLCLSRTRVELKVSTERFLLFVDEEGLYHNTKNIAIIST